MKMGGFHHDFIRFVTFLRLGLGVKFSLERKGAPVGGGSKELPRGRPYQIIERNTPYSRLLLLYYLREIKTTGGMTPLGDRNGKPDRVAVVLSRLQPTPCVGLSSEYGWLEYILQLSLSLKKKV